MRKVFPVAYQFARKEIVVQDPGSARRKIDELQSIILRLERAIKQDRLKRAAPETLRIVRQLNNMHKKGLPLYYEILAGRYRFIANTGGGPQFRLNRNGRIVFAFEEDVEKHDPIDRVFVLNLDGPSELAYEYEK